MSGLLPLQEAQQLLLAGVEPLSIEICRTRQAAGRYLAEDILALRSSPAADLSAMDGFAIAGSGPWKVVGESRAGQPHDGILTTGLAVRISTGAVLPVGAEAVLIRENAQLDADRLSATGGEPARGAHVRRAGGDFARGELIMERGRRLDPAGLGLAIASGMDEVEVYRKPSFAILETGDELASEWNAEASNRIPATNGAMLAAMLGGSASDIALAEPVGDAPAALDAAIQMHADYDCLITIGGASVGGHDLVRPALERAGAQIAFHRVAMKPGKPLMFARRRDQHIIGLPGNPVSSFVTAFLFVLPMARALAGSPAPLPQRRMMRLAADLPKGGARREFLRGKAGCDGAVALERQDSAGLKALAEADILIERAEFASEDKAGTYVPVYDIRSDAFA